MTAAIVERNIHARCSVKFQLATLDYCRAAGDALLEVCKATVRYLDHAARVIDRALNLEDAAIVGHKCASIGNRIAAGVESECLLARVRVDCAAVLVDEPKISVAVADMASADDVAVVRQRATFTAGDNVIVGAVEHDRSRAVERDIAFDDEVGIIFRLRQADEIVPQS